MVAVDQIGRILLSLVLGSATTNYRPMLYLMCRYLEFESQVEQIKERTGSKAASPTKKQRMNPSPSRVPKVNLPVEADSALMQ
jgi:hypothetical protein